MRRTSLPLLLLLSLLLAGAPGRAEGPSFPPVLPAGPHPSPVFGRYASLPPFGSAPPGPGELILAPGLEIAQLMIFSWEEGPEGPLPRANLDFEALSLELPLAWGLGESLSLELVLGLRLIWGGVLDGFVEGFHGLFGFPNGGRELFPRGRVAVAVETGNGYSLRAGEAALLLPDPLLGAALRLLEGPRLGLGARAFASLPLGLGRGLAGSELPQLGLGAALDWSPGPAWSLSLALGGILPLESLGWAGTRPFPMAQARLYAFFGPPEGRRCFLGLEFKTSPQSGEVYSGSRDFFREPSADLILGLALPAGPPGPGRGQWALAFQEDPFGHNSSDFRLMGRAVFRRP